MPQNYSVGGVLVSKEEYEKANGIVQPKEVKKEEPKAEVKPAVKKVVKKKATKKQS